MVLVLACLVLQALFYGWGLNLSHKAAYDTLLRLRTKDNFEKGIFLMSSNEENGKSEKRLMSIGEVSKAIGITRRIILNYEAKGLLLPDKKEGTAGNRYYTG